MREHGDVTWSEAQTHSSISFTCGNCGNQVASIQGWQGKVYLGPTADIRICPHCTLPSFFLEPDLQYPGPIPGHSVANIEESSVEDLYQEARKAVGAGSNTGAVLCCRKLLMHIAVAKGAKPGKSFISYVQFLLDKNFVPPDAKDWVDHIRTHGNEANHEINISSREDAEELLAFSEMLLKVIFEFPARARLRSGKTGTP